MRKDTSMDCPKHCYMIQRGFTLVELITVMVIMGVLAALAAPRFFVRDAFDSRGFYDQTLSTLRHAQKIAIAQHRLVCVAFAANSITLTIDSNTPADGACNAAAAIPSGNLTSPGGVTPYVVNAPTGITYAPVPAGFTFNALGRPSAGRIISVNGYATVITVEAETGYVR